MKMLFSYFEIDGRPTSGDQCLNRPSLLLYVNLQILGKIYKPI